jgi:uncharacterized tellurite resistance protein B-like protein
LRKKRAAEEPMLQALKKLIADIGDDRAHPDRFAEDDYRLAAAALLVHTANIDGNFADHERARLRRIVQQNFDLDEATTDELIAEAIEAERRSIDLYQFTSKLNRTLDEKGRARMVEMMWQIVFADGIVTEFEDNLIWRAADLLGVSREERIALRERVATAQ